MTKQTQPLPTHLGVLLVLTLTAPSAAFAYDNKDAIRDCESRLGRDYGLTDLRDARAVQLPGEKNYKVEGQAKIDGKKYPWSCRVADRRVVDVEYRGRRPSQSSGGRPEILPRRGGEIEVRMPSGCTSRYDRDGDLITRSSGCSQSDRRHADDAADDYFREQGRRGGGSWHDDGDRPPRVIAGKNGESEVVFRNDCVVYYDRRGRRTEALPRCNGNQLMEADQAMRAYRRE
ncbi:hypothetical protein [Thiocystis violascens]|uniref:Uncharacterized protein n=1 Tax=Thiocystis violascens (strain ATCC 17096 / DSM 198 / 6111) TaxID=765911 RepID=I3YDQ0_THIV6|nr:hypothetical protein [Thiocystis violascens]AFL75118.1 hypothetical protein Thivi_3243 [Thiocystis violascens DSM 198]